MKDNRVIGRIAVVVMAVPVGSFDMDFHIPGPDMAADGYFGIEKVGTGIGVELSRVNDTHRTPVGGEEKFLRPQTMLPEVLHQPFHKEREDEGAGKIRGVKPDA